jgi:hypothetical protein
MQIRIKRSIIWKKSKEEFQEHCKNYQSLADILRSLNLHPGAGNYTTLKNRILSENIDVSHISLGLNNGKGRKQGGCKPTPLELVLVENSEYSRKSLKNSSYKIIVYQMNVLYVNKDLYGKIIL